MTKPHDHFDLGLMSIEVRSTLKAEQANNRPEIQDKIDLRPSEAPVRIALKYEGA